MKTIDDYIVEFSTENQHIEDNKDYLLYEFSKTIINSLSTGEFREIVINSVCGLKRSTTKLGYDSDSGNYEIKSKIFLNGTSKQKLNGGGNFSDLTWNRHKKYLSDRAIMLVGGFVDGILIYVLSFPYNELRILINKKLTKKFGKNKKKKRKIGEYLRSVSFSHCAYSFSVEYVNENIHDYTYAISKPFMKRIESVI